MKWRGRRASTNVDDRRARGGGRRPVAMGGGCGLIIIILIFALLGGDPVALLNQMESTAPTSSQSGPATLSPEQDELAQFVSVVLADTEDIWQELFRARGEQYREPKLILFSDYVKSACGHASATSGPFYCPRDQSIYIDLSFYEELRRRYGAPGDFAQAYVIAHEVGHHVQNLLGIMQEVQSMRGRISKEDYNLLSVRLELQADFLAGVWAHHAQRTKRILEEGDVEEALRAANAIGDDTIQKRAQGYIVPESFTHGTSEQRMRWFLKGFKTGDMTQGDTFNAKAL